MSNEKLDEVMNRTPRKLDASGWWMLFVLFALYMVSIVDRYIIYMLGPQIKESFDLSDSELGLILGPAFSVSYALLGIPFGWAADRFSRRVIIFCGAVVFGMASIGSATATGFAVLFLMRAVVGVGESSLSPSAYSLLGDRFPREQLTTANSIFVSAANFGHAVAYALGGAALVLFSHTVIEGYGAVEPWRLVLICAGAPAVILAFLIFTFREPARNNFSKGEDSGVGLWDFLRGEGKLIIPLLLCFALSGIYGTAMVSWTPTYLSRHFDLSPAYYGAILGAIGLASGFSLIIKGAIVDWFYRRGVKDIHIRFYTFLLIGSMPLVAVMWLTDSPAIYLGTYGFLQVVTVTMLAYIAPAVQLLTPSSLRGRIMATFLVVYSVVGASIGPPLVGWLTDTVFEDPSKLGYSVFAVMGALMPLTAVILLMTLKPIRRRVLHIESLESQPTPMRT